MNEVQAVENLKFLKGKLFNGIFKNKLECLDVAIEALEKQMPKKPSVEGDGYADGHLVYDTWICPNCEKHYEIDYDNYDYCPNCGQHIDSSQLN